MSWFIVELTKEEQEIVHQERQLHPNLKIRERMNIIWYLHNQLTRKQAAALALVDRSSVERVMVMYRDGGLDGLRVWKVEGPTSELASYTDTIRNSLESDPVRTTAEAVARIEELTGVKRGLTQVRKFLKELGFKFQRVGMLPLPPKKVSKNTFRLRQITTTIN